MIYRVILLLAVAVWTAKAQNQAQTTMTSPEKLQAMRELMKKEKLDAYILVNRDMHASEYVANYDKRVEWLTSFSGSNGIAILTQTEATLWTDSRYFLQAENELPKPWKLKKDPFSQIKVWLVANVPKDGTVGENNARASIDGWKESETYLTQNNRKLRSPVTDMTDRIWPSSERPPKPSSLIYEHAMEFAGETWQSKIGRVQSEIREAKADVLVVNSLDEIAWLFNLRASDFPNQPFFFAFALVSANNETKTKLFLDDDRVTQEIRDFLDDSVEFRPYDSIFEDVAAIDPKQKVWIAASASYKIYNNLQNKENTIMDKLSPVQTLKAVKSKVELENLRRCHLRDSAYRVRHMFWLEEQMKSGAGLTEITSQDKLAEIQTEDKNFKMLSFGSISAVGSNAAIVHYSAKKGQEKNLTTNEVYLLDAGGNYLDCSTDVTRTHHYGVPKAEEIFAYTKVLQGMVNLGAMIFPPGTYGSSLDVAARSPLWRAGLDYGHGTGHGIGYFSSIHESPPAISISGAKSSKEKRLVEGMISSDEPGYYEEGKMGFRLETDVEVAKAVTANNFNGRQYLKFDPLTWIPFEKNLIDECLLTRSQVEWLNEYNNATRSKLTPLLDAEEIRDYLIAKTEPFEFVSCNSESTSGASSSFSSLSGRFSVFSTLMMFFVFATKFFD